MSYWYCVSFFWKIYQKANLPFLIGILYQFSGRYIGRYIFSFWLRLCTISLEDLSARIFSVSDWDCVSFFWKIYQKVYLPCLIGILYKFSVRSIRKRTLRFLFGLRTSSLESLSESIASISYWDCVPFLWKI